MPDSEVAQELTIAKRFHVPRTIASLLGFITVSATFYQLKLDLVFYVGPLLQGLFWPHIAYFLTKRFHADGYSERKSLLVDSFLGGIWIPFMAFNVLPTVVLSTTLWLNNISAEGPRFFLKGFIAQLCGLILGILIIGFRWLPESSMTVILACIPILLLYPIAVASISYKLSKALSNQKRVLAHLSQHDALTSLYNRGYWEVLSVQEFKNNKSFEEPCCLIFLDVDHFKHINDTYGHTTGDEVLRKVGKIIRDNLRPLDIPGRYGGEEFGIVLPETEKEVAIGVAEHLRKAIEESLIATSNQACIEITVSIGLAQLTNHIKTYDQWLESADSALYQAKQSGRNKCKLYECANNRQPQRLP